MSRLRSWIANLLRNLGDWIDPFVVQHLHIPVDDLWLRARALTKDAESFAPGTSGDYKRAHVYAQLQREFPSRSLRALAQVIEAVL